MLYSGDLRDGDVLLVIGMQAGDTELLFAIEVGEEAIVASQVVFEGAEFMLIGDATLLGLLKRQMEAEVAALH